MATRVDYEEALEIVEQQVRGLNALLLIVFLPPIVLRAISDQITVRERRANFLRNILNLMDQLDAAEAAVVADGFPALPHAEVPHEVIEALNKQKQDIESAASIFMDLAAATQITLTQTGQPVDK